MRSTSLAGAPTEFISQNYENYWSVRWNTRNYAEFLDKVLEIGTTTNGVFGLKAHYYQFKYFLNKVRVLNADASATPASLAARFLHVQSYIWLRRRDRIGQAISYLRALQTDVWWHADVAPAPYCEPRPDNLRFDFLALNRLITRLDNEEQQWGHYFQQSGTTPLELFYEELVESLPLVIAKILDFLKIEAPINRIFVPVGTHKLADRQSEAWKERYRALAAAQFERSLSAYKDIHHGKVILVCGLGESLNLLEKPGRFITIGVNDIGRKFHPDYLIVADQPSKFPRDRFQYIEASQAGAVFTNQKNLGIMHPNIVPFLISTDRQARLPERHVLFVPERPWYTPYLGVALAAHMGAESIGLIGVDFSDNYFFGDVGRHHGLGALQYTNDNFRALQNLLLEHGIKLLNLSPTSRLSSVPYRPLDSLADRSRPTLRLSGMPRPMRIAIYGPESPGHTLRALSARIASSTPHHARFVAIETTDTSAEHAFDDSSRAADDVELAQCDIVIIRNGRHLDRHRELLSERAIVTLVEDPGEVDWQFARRGYPVVMHAGCATQLAVPFDVLFVPEALPDLLPARNLEFDDGQIQASYLEFRTDADGSRLARDTGSVRRVLHDLVRSFDRQRRLKITPILPNMLDTGEVIEILARSQIFIGDVVRGGYELADLLAMACGAIAIGNIGTNPAVRARLRRIARTDDIPFVQASARCLQPVMQCMLRRGASALSEDGAASARWMRQHWIFERDWEAVWLPILSRALRVRSREDMVPAAAIRRGACAAANGSAGSWY